MTLSKAIILEGFKTVALQTHHDEKNRDDPLMSAEDAVGDVDA